MSRRIEIVVYHSLSVVPANLVRITDAIESAWKNSGYHPFTGEDPIFFGWKWETDTKDPKRFLKAWDHIVTELHRRKFLNPDGALIYPGYMSALPASESYHRSWMIFERR